MSSTVINSVMPSILASLSSFPSLLLLPSELLRPISWLSLLSLLSDGENVELVSEGGVRGLTRYWSRDWSGIGLVRDWTVSLHPPYAAVASSE